MFPFRKRPPTKADALMQLLGVATRLSRAAQVHMFNCDEQAGILLIRENQLANGIFDHVDMMNDIQFQLLLLSYSESYDLTVSSKTRTLSKQDFLRHSEDIVSDLCTKLVEAQTANNLRDIAQLELTLKFVEQFRSMAIHRS